MKNIFVMLLLSYGVTAFGQNTFKAKIIDAESGEPLIGATAQISSTQGDIANENGQVTITNIPNGDVKVKFSFVGYQAISKKYIFPREDALVIIELEPSEDEEEVIVSATRSGGTIDDIPTRIEVLGTEELAEKAVMRSSNIAMVLRESTGIQMQITSASSANQSIRIQGLDGRYTQILKDGFPLFGGFSGGLSIMQIPPLDLRQVEVVKGSNSTLYGGGAIAGLVNLVTRTPDEERALRLMVDQTQARGTTINSFYAEQFDKFGLTLFTSLGRQDAYDSNNDDFSDIPRIRGLTFNPSFFYNFNPKSRLRLTLNATLENRLGGDIQVIEGGTNGIHQFTEENKSERFNYQLSYDRDVDENKSFHFKHSITYFDREIVEPSFTFAGKQWSSFNEASYNFGQERSRFILGANLYTDRFDENPLGGLSRDYSHTTIGVFAQNTFKISEKYALESGMRIDYNDEYGPFALPRASLLAKVNDKFSVRLGGGLGYKLPTIFTEDAENLTFQNILPIDPNLLVAEQSLGGNFDLNYKTAIGTDWTLSVNQLFFSTRINDALVFRENQGQYFYENADGPVTSQGIETNIKLTYKDFKFFANYALIDAKLKYDNINRQKPLTAKHNIGAVLVYEVEDKWRVGLESYYTGSQFRGDGSTTDDFWIVGFMVLRKFEKLSLYINFENFTDTRQHKLENFTIGNHFKPAFPEIWAPTDGSIINTGFIFDF
ncbi:TonB-dependent receptor [Roseivirga sp.]|uniref:TonB-dependent receptor n=1 Tax=Roseivirga sp. TaxID=1964215 RepID=UPI003B8D2B61